MSDDVLTFPPGTPVGRAFTSPEDAVLWLRDALDGIYGPMHTVLLGLTPSDWLTTRPVMVAASDLPALVVEAVVDVFGEVTIPAGAPEAPFAWYTTGPTTPARDLDLYRRVRGWEATARAVFQAADKRDRPTAAKLLGDYERALEAQAATTTASLNRWINTAWVDALNAGRDVTPNPIDPAHPTTPTATWRLGT